MENMEHIVKLKEIAKNHTILFVEDSKALQKQIMKFLSKLFKEVYVASDGQEGLIMYEDKKPDLILTDLTMPKMTGHEMIREIKKINPDAEIIILSAHSDSETLMKSFHIGVSDFIAKPVNAPKMITVFLKVLSNLKRKEYQFLELAGGVGELSKDSSEILKFLYENGSKLDIVNHYKGVPIINSGKIVKIEDDNITLRTTNIQLLAIKEEGFAILDSSLVSEDIKCSLVEIKNDDYEVVLKKEEVFYPDSKQRDEIIVQPHESMKAYILKDAKTRIEVKVLGISRKELFLNMEEDKFIYDKHDVLKLVLILSIDENQKPIEYLNLNLTLFKIDHQDNNSVDMRVLIKEENVKTESTLQKFIFKREAELIEEFKEKFQHS